MGYDIEFFPLRLALELPGVELDHLVRYLAACAGPGEQRAHGVTYGGSNYLLNRVRVEPYDDGGPVEKQAVRARGFSLAFGRCGDDRWRAFRLDHGSYRWTTEGTLQVLTRAFDWLGGTLGGVFGGEDGREWALRAPGGVLGRVAWLPLADGATGAIAEFGAAMIASAADPTARPIGALPLPVTAHGFDRAGQRVAVVPAQGNGRAEAEMLLALGDCPPFTVISPQPLPAEVEARVLAFNAARGEEREVDPLWASPPPLPAAETPGKPQVDPTTSLDALRALRDEAARELSRELLALPDPPAAVFEFLDGHRYTSWRWHLAHPRCPREMVDRALGGGEADALEALAGNPTLSLDDRRCLLAAAPRGSQARNAALRRAPVAQAEEVLAARDPADLRQLAFTESLNEDQVRRLASMAWSDPLVRIALGRHRATPRDLRLSLAADRDGARAVAESPASEDEALVAVVDAALARGDPWTAEVAFARTWRGPRPLRLQYGPHLDLATRRQWFAVLLDVRRPEADRIDALEHLVSWSRDIDPRSYDLAPWLPLETPPELLAPFAARAVDPVVRPAGWGRPPTASQRLFALIRHPGTPEAMRREAFARLGPALDDPWREAWTEAR